MAGVKLEKERTKGIVKFCIKSENNFSVESFVNGFDFGINTSLKILKDKRNKYKAWLSEEIKVKLSKTANVEKISAYRNYIWILNELIKDFENGK